MVDTVMTPLTAGSLTTGSYQQVALDNLVARAQEDIQKKQTKLEATFDAKAAAIDAESERYIKLSSGVKNAQVAMDNGLESINKISDLLSKMSAALGGIESSFNDTGEVSQYWVNQYNDALRQINVTADLYGASFNPVGRVQDRMTWEPNDISFNPNFTSTTTTLNGVYAGADFRIEVTDAGTGQTSYWIPDLGSSTLTEYTSYNTQHPTESDGIGETVSLLNGIKSVQDNGDGTVTLTAFINGAEESITGKMVTGGLGLTGSWNHGNFGVVSEGDPAPTAEDIAGFIQGAIEEISRAQGVLTGAKAQITANMATANSAQDRITEKTKALTADRKDALYEQLEAETALQQEYAQQVEAMQRNLDAMSTQQQAYLSVFASTIASFGDNNPLFVNQTV
ncbi:hypothetical protein [Pararhodospirillum oryzae]|uniref:Flagellin N-terminal domain-containing protein n=1 Tax=Pararhodospirillum oryzae TaxID=478448 RepID=A0A512H832_9PROT|nr:hypothetical protein [Pararhodospirillum oryzae]GEO81615.1 hypothetical protein ROR02_17460 [Pararhodospirillum oryzae]